MHCGTDILTCFMSTNVDVLKVHQTNIIHNFCYIKWSLWGLAENSRNKVPLISFNILANMFLRLEVLLSMLSNRLRGPDSETFEGGSSLDSETTALFITLKNV